KSIYVNEEGSYDCVVKNIHNCSNQSDPIQINVHPAINDPQLHFQASGVLRIVHDSIDVQSYRWYFNDGLIDDAIDSIYIPLEVGYYRASLERNINRINSIINQPVIKIPSIRLNIN